MADLDVLQRRFLAQRDHQRSRTPFYSRLCEVIADQPEVLDLLRSAPELQQLPVLLLAALHHDVLVEPDCELAEWYPTTNPSPRTDDVTAALRRHCRRRDGALRTAIATRSTQTNEVGRCGLFVPPLGVVAAEVGDIALVDVGTSAGLNLALDRYHYHYAPGGEVGDADSTVRIEVGTRGFVPVPGALPNVAGRIGLDREPVDVHDDDAVLWLRACVWPEQTDRLDRFDAAIAIARVDPPSIRVGDAVDDLAAVIESVAGVGGHPVVLNSWVLNYLTAARRRDYVAALDQVAAHRDLSWIFAESPAQADGLPFPSELTGHELTAVMMVTWRDSERTVHHVGVAHPHGYWLHGP
jgi:hypothetical protein